jgi:hypothetical protein
MKPIEEVYSFVESSDFITIGYNSFSESFKDEFISKLPILRLSEVSSSFDFDDIINSIKRSFRERRLVSLLNDDTVEDLMIKFDFLVIDYSYFEVEMKNIQGGMMGAEIFKNRKFESLRSQAIRDGFKVIYTSSLYRSVADNQRSKDNFLIKGGRHPLYVSDLVLYMTEDGISIIKNRYGHQKTFSLNELK